jgi:SAM-dependent methyltransferase
LGLGDSFEYQRCGKCGSMQLQNPPEDFSRYYPNENYYSFNLEQKTPIADTLQRAKASYLLYGKNVILGSLLSIGYKMPDYYQWMKATGARRNDAILDVGCGNGSLLSKLATIGFTNLTGIDPFIDADAMLGNIKILKKEIYDLEQPFDLIMMHHSLEHMFKPLDALQKAHALLKKSGTLLVRIPIMGKYGWQHYGTLWCGLDAPRHIFIPSEEAFKLLAQQAGFQLAKLEYDSSDYVIWSSEQYMRGIPLHAPNSRMVSKKASIFSKEEIKLFRKTIAAENRKDNGDTAAFYLKKA